MVCVFRAYLSSCKLNIIRCGAPSYIIKNQNTLWRKGGICNQRKIWLPTCKLLLYSRLTSMANILFLKIIAYFLPAAHKQTSSHIHVEHFFLTKCSLFVFSQPKIRLKLLHNFGRRTVWCFTTYTYFYVHDIFYINA